MSPKNHENISKFQGWGLTLFAYKKESVVRHVVLDFRNVTQLTVHQQASSPTDSFSMDISPMRQLPNQAFLWSGSSPILHFTEWTVITLSQVTISVLYSFISGSIVGKEIQSPSLYLILQFLTSTSFEEIVLIPQLNSSYVATFSVLKSPFLSRVGKWHNWI